MAKRKLELLKEPFNWKHLVFLILYGVLTTYVRFFCSIACYIIVIYSIINLKDLKDKRLWQVAFASPFLEVWGRATKAPLLPYELGKYYLAAACIGMFIKWGLARKVHPPLYHTGKLLLLSLTPSLIYAFLNVKFNYQYWVFNAFGPLEIAFLLIFAAKERWTEDEFFGMLRNAVVLIIPFLVYITLKTPDFEDVNFRLGANFQTTGGFGSNQVSTILGAAFFLTFLLSQYKYPVFKEPVLNYGLIGYAFFRGLLTFSRGGVVVAVIAMIICYLPVMFRSAQSLTKSIFVGILVIIGGVTVFIIADNITGNNLTLRYKGETAGTLKGTKEQSLNNITSRRSDIAIQDYLIFLDHPIYGVGPGEARFYREQYGGINVIAHVEYSRLLSEHGIGGAVNIVIMILFVFFWVAKVKSQKGKYISLAFFILAMATTFHAAMRTNTTTVFFVFAAIPVLYHKRKYMSFQPA